MALSSVELWQRISTSQLASPMICRAWAADCAAHLSATDTIDAAKVAEQLVAQGKLTQFQAETLLDGSDQPLVIHGYRLLEPVNHTPYPAPDVRSVFSGWWLAAKSPTATPAWMRWLTVDDLKQNYVAAAHPALPRVLQQAQVRQENLQAVEPPEMASGALQLSLQPVAGKLLTSICDGKPQSSDTIMRLMLEVGGALAALHAVGLTHGRVAPDRICVSLNNRFQLLRDPLCSLSLQLCATESERRSPQGLMAQKLPGKLTTAHFMAPEFLAPAQIATPQTDLYSLGCVAWLLATGKPPFHAEQGEMILAAHAEKPLARDAVANLPEPLVRCLWHCLAKNPAARFPSARHLVESLQEAQRLIARGPSKTPLAPKADVKLIDVVSEVVKSGVVKSEVVKSEVVKLVADTTPQVVPSQAGAVAQPTRPVKPIQSEPVTQLVKSELQPDVQPKPPVEPKPTKPPALSTAASQPAEALDAAIVKATVNAQAAPTPPESAAQPKAVEPSPGVTDAPLPGAQGEGSTPQQASSAATAMKPGPRKAAPGKPPVRRAGSRGVRKPGNQRKQSNWLTPVIGGGGLVALILLLMVMRGGLGGASNSGTSKKNNNQTPSVLPENGGNNTGDNTETVPADPLVEKFELVNDDPAALWAPPRAPDPIPLDLLPPGAQAFISVRPAALFGSASNKQLLSLLEPDIAEFWSWLNQTSGVPNESIDRAVIAAYPGQNGMPQYAVRIDLGQPMPLSKLKGVWNLTAEAKVQQQTLLVSDKQAYYVAQQPLVDSQSVTSFAVGGTEIMREAAGLQGARGPLASAMEQLWQNSDRQSEFSFLLSPAFLVNEGRGWLEKSPPRLKSLVQSWLPRETRGLMVTSSFGERWFYEIRLAGASDRDAVVYQQRINDLKEKLPQEVETWLVNELAHPHWRAIATRFPNMLRALSSQTRVATENGQAIANGYLPTGAAANLVYASWMAMQPSSTTSATVVTNDAAPAGPTLTPAQILDRKISLSTDPVGVEVVLALIAEQANDKLPAGTKPIKFELNGTAFQLAGFTRNFQVRDYKVDNQTVREALMLLVKKANPVQNADPKSKDQQMIWVLLDGDNADKAMVSLTSREAATTAQQPLPAEFAAAGT